MARNPAIGIDLGTTDSCVAIFHNGIVEVIPNETGNLTTPSYVAFTKTERFIGEAAKNQLAVNPENTIFAVKRLIGRHYDDSVVEASRKNWPFRVINDGGKPKILVNYRGRPIHLCAEEISAMILSKMKELAENHLGQSIKDAVITVPAYFNDAQRQATKNAGAIAGLRVLRIINEPTAAAVTFGLDKRSKHKRHMLIFDLGGGTCNVSILVLEDHIYEVMSTSGDNKLGGEDFDEQLMKYLIKQFKDKHRKDLSSSKRALNRLRIACEKAKRVLSSCNQTIITLDGLFEGTDFCSTLNRKEFEQVNEDLFRATLDPVKKALRDAKLTVEQIDDVVLVGGSTRIPYIQKLLQDLFKGKELNKSMTMVESVASGAAIQAAILAGDRSQRLQDMLLVDVIPLSLGIEIAGGIMTAFVKRNTRIPTRQTYTHTVTSYKGPSVAIKVYEGERAMVKDNQLLGQFELAVPVTNRDTVRIELIFDIDADSILNVLAREEGSEEQCQVTINGSNRLKQKELERMIRNAEKYREDDRRQQRVAVVRNNLESYCYTVRELLENKVVKACEETLAWLETEGQSVVDVEEFERKRKELEDLCGGEPENKSKQDRNTSATEATYINVLTTETSLDRLRCGACNRFLSCFPVYVARDKMAVCGRCSDVFTGDDAYFRNVSYEALAECLKFPCIYHSEGCLKRLLPSEVPEHERNCSFRTTCCKRCRWEGIINDLLQHFEEQHPSSVLRNGEFEVIISTDYEYHGLLVYKDEVFGFDWKYDYSKGVLESTVFCYKVVDSGVMYDYQITLMNGSKSLSMTCPRKSAVQEDNAIEISGEEMKQALNNPSVIIGTIRILEPDTTKSPIRSKRTNPAVNYDLLTELECPVCFHYIVPPIYQCQTGHSVCEECKTKISECPICKRSIQNHHNITLEKVTKLLVYPCRFAEYGCDFTSKPTEIREHQKYCYCGPYPCPLREYKNCTWKNPVKNMFEHVQSSHPDHVLDANTIRVCVDGNYFDREDCACYVIKYCGLPFKLQYLYKERVFYWAVQSVGVPEEAGKYRFEIDIEDNCNRNKRRMFLSSVCAPLAAKDESFKRKDSFVFIKLEQIRSFISDVFTYKIRVTT